MNDDEITIMGYTWPEGSQATLLQGDMLHTTLEGTVAAAMFIEELLGTLGLETDPQTIMKNAAAEARKN